MRSQRRRITELFVLSGAVLPASGCDVTDRVLGTIAAAFRIVDIGV